MATIGLRDVHYALLVDDPITGVPTYETPQRVVGAITANINPNSSSATLFYDDGPGDTAATMGEITLELNLADIPLPIQAIWLGHEYSGGVLKRRGTDTPPWLAIGFRSLKSNGAYKYVWLNKGKFALPEEAYNTKGDSIEFSTPTISGSFVKRDNDDEWQRTADEDDDSFNPSYVSTWFLSPMTISGAYGTSSYGDTLITLAGPAALAGTEVIITASDAIDPGAETAVWAAKSLTITLSDGVSYTKNALQGIIDGATGNAPGDLTILTDSSLKAETGITFEVTLSM